MQCLVIGDLHLEGSGGQLTVPDTWAEYEVAIIVGDLLSRSARNPVHGQKLLEKLDSLPLETVVVPGNHDYQHYPELVSGFSSVHSVHRTATKIGGWYFYGLGSDQFDDGAEIRYPEIPELSYADSNPEQLERQLTDVITGQLDLTDVVEDDQAVEIINRSLDMYRDRLEVLDNIAPHNKDTQSVLVTHLPPFGTGLDRLSSQNPRYPGQLLGSIAVRSHIRRFSPIFNICGHVHEGEGIIKSEGCVCLNAGLRSTYSIEVNRMSRNAITQRTDSISLVGSK